jgi:NitT/TauT family transport system permease protein
MKRRGGDILLHHILPPVAVLFIGLLVWHLVVHLFQVPEYLLPGPRAVLAAARDHSGELARSTANTAIAAGLGFGVSVCAGVLIAVLLSTSRIVQRALGPYMIFFQTVPIVAIAPLLAIWLDYGRNAVAASAFITSIFPVVANTLAGLLATDPSLRDLFRLYRAGPMATLLKLRLPAALPNILTGLRIAAGLAVIGAIVGEFVVGTLDVNAGIGVMVLVEKRLGNTDVIIAAVLAASLLGLAALAAINLLSWVLLRHWHASQA